MNFNVKSTFCIFAIAMATNLVVINGMPAEEQPPALTTEATASDKEGKTTFEHVSDTTTHKSTLSQSSSSSSSSSSSVSVTPDKPELPQGDQPGDEPNGQSRPEVEPTVKPTKETTTEPPLLHTTKETSMASSTTTTTSTTPRPSMPVGGSSNISEKPGSSNASEKPGSTHATTPKPGQNAAPGLNAVQFSCFVASAMLVLLR